MITSLQDSASHTLQLDVTLLERALPASVVRVSDISVEAHVEAGRKDSMISKYPTKLYVDLVGDLNVLAKLFTAFASFFESVFTVTF